MDKIEFFRHSLSEEDISRACKVMRSVFLTTGPKVKEFEQKFSHYLNIKNTIGLTSCTGALHLCLLRHGIGPGDEVITTPMTFVATATAIIEAGAEPVFVDVCPKSGLLLPESIEHAISKNTKAIIPVHLYGRMVDMKKFNSIAKKHNLFLIEDAAHCIEGIRNGIKPGQLSDAACFSFYATKNITCGEGGAIVCRSENDANWYRAARHHGISKNASSRYSKQFRHWDMEMMGWKYNMDDIHAALLIGQVDTLESNRMRRQQLETLYRDTLAGLEGLKFLEKPEKNERSSHHLLTVLLPNEDIRDSMIEYLQTRDIGCAVNYQAIHTLSYFKDTYNYQKEDFPVAFRLGCRTLSLPLYPKLTEQQVEYVCLQIKNGLKKLW